MHINLEIKYFCFLVFFVLIFIGVRAFIRFNETKEWIKKVLAEIPGTGYPPDKVPLIALIIPILREQKAIADLLKSLSALQYPKEKIHIYLVTTEKENYEKELRQRDLLKNVSGILKSGKNPDHLKSFIQQELDISNSDPLWETLTQPHEFLLKLEKYLQEIPDSARVIAGLLKENDTPQQDCGVFRSQNKTPGFIRHLHFPFSQGNMADQLNYCLSVISKEYSASDLNDLILGIYNADSDPHPDTLRILAWLETKREPRKTVYQQHSIYFVSKHENSNAVDRWLAEGAALWQTRWSLCFEVPEILQRLWLSSLKLLPAGLKKLAWNKFVYCIGHGLFVPYRILERTGYFPSETMNEDAFLGYLLCLSGCPVYPLPVLEFAESPARIASVIKQRSSWFWGPLQAFVYRQHVPQNILAGYSLPTFQAVQLLSHAVSWLTGPLILWACIICSFLTDKLLLSACLTAFVIYLGPSSLLAARFRNALKISRGEKKTPFLATIAALLSIFIHYLFFHWVGPAECIMQAIQWKLFSKAPVKYKTER